MSKKKWPAAWGAPGRQQAERGLLMQSAEQLGQRIGVEAACDALSVPRSSLYRARRPSPERSRAKISPRAFSQAEKIKVCEELNSERFQDCAPREVYGTLLDEGHFLCSWRSMYRILAENQEVRERRNQVRHPNYSKPELLATGPNQLWSWDITKLRGPTKWTYYYLLYLVQPGTSSQWFGSVDSSRCR